MTQRQRFFSGFLAVALLAPAVAWAALTGGTTVIQTDNNGQLWYITPDKSERQYIGDEYDAFMFMRDYAIGITNEHLRHIPIGEANFEGEDQDRDGLSDRIEASVGTDPSMIDTDGDGHDDKTEVLEGHNPLGPGAYTFSTILQHRLSGAVVLQTEGNGEAWWINPFDKKRYFLGSPHQAFTLLRQVALGATTPELEDISIANTIADVAIESGSFDTLVSLLATADLVGTVQSDGPFTVFAPTDAAFAKLPPELLSAVQSDTSLLTEVLLYHVVPGRLYAADVISQVELPTAQGEAIDITVLPNPQANQAQIIQTDIRAGNGVIHVIDEVILPPSLASSDTDTDTMEQVSEQTNTNQETTMSNIIETAQSAGTFNTLLTAIEAAGLTAVLASGGPFTVFAPTDDAFAKIDPETLESLLSDQDALTQVLTYHVVEGVVPASQVVELSSVVTLQGGEARIAVGENGVMIDKSIVTATDVQADNGIIHIIDTVLLPEFNQEQ